MAFTVSDFDDLKRLLGEHPEWRVELHHLLWTEDMEALPGIVRDLVEAQRRGEERLQHVEGRLERVEKRLERVEERLEHVEGRLERVEGRLERVEGRLDRLETSVQALVEAQQRTEERLQRLEASVRALVEAQQVTEERLQRLEASVQALVVSQQRMVEQIDRLADRVGRSDGLFLEIQYDRKAAGYFGRRLRRPRPVDRDELWEQLEARLGAEEMHDALLADLVIRGRLSSDTDRPERYLIVEVSSVVDEHDVARAIRRAELFCRAGFPAIPGVAGREATEGAHAVAKEHGVALFQDGSENYWDLATLHWPVAEG